MKNLDTDMCLDQGPQPGHTPIAFECHVFGPQVVTKCVAKFNDYNLWKVN